MSKLAPNLKKLTLLHSNDLHGDFLAEEIDKNLIGGVSRLSGYLQKARSEDPNVLYAIAGDMFRGSVIDSEFRGISTIEIMNLLAPDVVTIGNHEVDYGLPHLLFIEKCATFPIVNANFYIKSSHKRLFDPCYIAEIDGMRILFIGIITEEILASTKADEMIGTLLNIEEAAYEVGKICDAYNRTDVDLTVLLTHIGHEEDKQLAAALDPAWGVDIIIGGHSHTFLDEPAVVNDIVIVQAGTGTDQIGRFDMVVNTDTNSIESYEWSTIPINAETCPRDEVLEDLIQGFKAKTDEKYGRLLTRFRSELTHPVRHQETALGNLVADLMKDSLGVDIMFSGSGSIRLEKMGPIVTLGDVCQVFPYDDAVYELTFTGAQLKNTFKHILRDEAFAGHTEFYQFSHGTHIVYNIDSHELIECSLNGVPLGDDQLYTIGLQKFHYMNLKPFLDVTLEELEANAKPRTLATSARNVIEEYFDSHPHLDSCVEERIVTIKDGKRWFPSEDQCECGCH